MGKILRVDLTKAKMKAEAIPEDWKINYIGGNGLPPESFTMSSTQA